VEKDTLTSREGCRRKAAVLYRSPGGMRGIKRTRRNQRAASGETGFFEVMIWIRNVAIKAQKAGGLIGSG